MGAGVRAGWAGPEKSTKKGASGLGSLLDTEGGHAAPSPFPGAGNAYLES